MLENQRPIEVHSNRTPFINSLFLPFQHLRGFIICCMKYRVQSYCLSSCVSNSEYELNLKLLASDFMATRIVSSLSRKKTLEMFFLFFSVFIPSRELKPTFVVTVHFLLQCWFGFSKRLTTQSSLLLLGQRVMQWCQNGLTSGKETAEVLLLVKGH